MFKERMDGNSLKLYPFVATQLKTTVYLKHEGSEAKQLAIATPFAAIETQVGVRNRGF